MSYAFTFDAKFCSGCKACQAACKDKNNLPLDVLWRRVIEVSGGAWQKDGAAWTNTVFAYNLSMACNHCIHPKCVGICPAGAYTVRDDGIVLLDAEKCMGCGYCAWGCPYGAPQYDPHAGTMTKCNFCFDNLDQGLPPACVAACPLRVLDYEETTTEMDRKGLQLWNIPVEQHPYPLSHSSHTQPHLAIQPHTVMYAAAEKSVANLEEIQPRRTSRWEDVPLILFTLLTQTAAGGFWAMLWTFPFGHRLPFLLIGLCLGVGMLASLTHLGTKRKAWRALVNWRKSWLSKEVLFTGLFGLGWLLSSLSSLIWNRSSTELMGLTATLGLGLVYSMSQVYRLPSIPAWNTWKTNAVFIVSALLLGQSMLAILLPYGSDLTDIILLILLLTQLSLMNKQFSDHPFHSIRTGLIFVGAALTVINFLSGGAGYVWLNILILIIVAAEETIGKWIFYQAAHTLFSSR